MQWPKFIMEWWLQVHMLYVPSSKIKIIKPQRARLQKVLMLLITVIKIYLYEIY
jgi:hypothetical protein